MSDEYGKRIANIPIKCQKCDVVIGGIIVTDRGLPTHSTFTCNGCGFPTITQYQVDASA